MLADRSWCIDGPCRRGGGHIRRPANAASAPEECVPGLREHCQGCRATMLCATLAFDNLHRHHSQRRITSMSSKALSLAVSLFLFSTISLAQNSPSTLPSTQPPAGRRGGPPCWQQAGIEKSVMEQRWASERETRSQVEAVCSNTSLTPQQKNQQVRDIRQQARQKMEGLVTPEQEKALTACQQQRGMNHPGGAGGRQWAGGGGCGEMPNSGSPNSGSRPSGAPNGAPGNGSGASGNGSAPPANAPPQNQ